MYHSGPQSSVGNTIRTRANSAGFTFHPSTASAVSRTASSAESVTTKKIAVKESPRRPGDPPELVAAARQARDALGWTPRFPELRPIIETAWNWHRTHPNGYGDR